MIARYRHPLLRLCLVALLALGLLATGLAHRAPSSSDEARAAFVLAGGNLGDLCGLPGEGVHGDCPACHLTGSADLPTANGLLRPANLVIAASFAAPHDTPMLRPVLDPAHGLRAPPLV
jgi:hypothetical protein